MSEILNEIKELSKYIKKDSLDKSAIARKLIDAIYNYNHRSCIETEMQLKSKFSIWKRNFENRQLKGRV